MVGTVRGVLEARSSLGGVDLEEEFMATTVSEVPLLGRERSRSILNWHARWLAEASDNSKGKLHTILCWDLLEPILFSCVNRCREHVHSVTQSSTRARHRKCELIQSNRVQRKEMKARGINTRGESLTLRAQLLG
jgi:hypothetical protein